MSKNVIIDLPAFAEQHHHKRVVFVSGNFNVVHAGHLRFLNFSRSLGDILVVGVFSDESPNIFFAIEDRIAVLKTIEPIDFILPLRAKDLLEKILIFQPHLVVKGSEYENQNNSEEQAVLSYGGQLIFASGETALSSRELLRNELKKPSGFHLRHDLHYLDRHKITLSRLKNLVSKFANKKICVLGEIIIDEYIHCDVLGVSREDPTVVVTPCDRSLFLGGAGIVSAHVKSLGVDAMILSTVGEDENGAVADRLLDSYGIQRFLIKDHSRPTVLKQRFRSSNKTLLRVNNLRSHSIDHRIENSIFEIFCSQSASIDAVVFSDFNYGCLPQTLVNRITNFCLAAKIPYFSDSQSSSQIGDVSRFKFSKLISATEYEARLGIGDHRSGLQDIANRLMDKTEAESLIVKLGPSGLIALSSEASAIVTDSLFALNPNCVDPSGAGDALLAALVVASICHGTFWESVYIGALCSGVQVARIGNSPVSKKELLDQLSG